MIALIEIPLLHRIKQVNTELHHFKFRLKVLTFEGLSNR